MAGYTQFYEARKLVTEILEKDLVGPVVEDECLTESPVQYYIMGKLYPQKSIVEQSSLIDSLEEEIEVNDPSISLSNQTNPSSMGITFTLKADVNKFHVFGSYAFYEIVKYSDAISVGVDTTKWEKWKKQPKELWRRKKYTYDKEVELAGEKSLEIDLERSVQLHICQRMILENGVRVITVSLVNKNYFEDNVFTSSQECVFQPSITISSTDDDSIFTNIESYDYLIQDKELLELDLLYSDVCCYAQGHGCSALWDLESLEPKWLQTSFFPNYNYLQMKTADFENGSILSMEFLSKESAQVIIFELRAFIDKYESWIGNLKSKLNNVKNELLDVAKENIAKCQNAYQRIVNAIDLLEQSSQGDNIAFRAFQLSNEAMLLQRKRTVVNKGEVFKAEEARWYPFQLAFLLQELTSFIKPCSCIDKKTERELVDLLWFPTGGGKTEAYLGITAFVIFLRRLRNINDDGVTVIMRYTLRLLTLQQFERASILIFSCEYLRKKYQLGGSEISIGLWVGNKLTPNSLNDARSCINRQILGNFKDDDSNPVQIKVCPWCGQKLTVHDYSVDMPRQRMLIRCSNIKCDFHSDEGLPVHIIDEAIYKHLPTFLISTVDKFAQLPLNDAPAALFGITSKKKPPELIIQDELHLISGPLGTMTGIYEAAISKLCEYNGIKAKIIASTATIRNASRQIRALYGREHCQFPPQGLSIKDSFFAVESNMMDKPARQYWGIMGVGTTATTTWIRVNAALIFATRYLTTKGYPDAVVDNFWTITGYFDSLRALGSATSHFLDNVQSRLEYLVKNKFELVYEGVELERKYVYPVELTSRMSNSEITQVIQIDLKKSYSKDDHRDVYDYLFASNMLSVGVDIGRLGAMVVTNQPKTNAEYIQATSRVGRANPGLVLVIYNASRSRDRSHYEQFLKYHTALYRYVEATSLTPFSDRARDRGLHALYVILCRYLVNELRENKGASKYSSNNPALKAIEQSIYEYVNTVDPDELDATIDELGEIKDIWDSKGRKDIVYKDYQNKEKSLLKLDTEDDRFRTMNSMRSVDDQPGLYLLGVE